MGSHQAIEGMAQLQNEASEEHMTSIPLVYSFWFMLAAYVVHIIDESLLGGSFVAKVQQHWWPQYSWRKFFWFNAAYLTLMATSIVLYDRIGSRLVFLPLAFLIESYWIAFCRPATQLLPLRSIWPGVVLGTMAAAFLSFYMPIVAKRFSGR